MKKHKIIRCFIAAARRKTTGKKVWKWGNSEFHSKFTEEFIRIKYGKLLIKYVKNCVIWGLKQFLRNKLYVAKQMTIRKNKFTFLTLIIIRKIIIKIKKYKYKDSLEVI